MANPFQEKFLKAGLVTKKQVNRVKVEQHKKDKSQRRKKGRAPNGEAQRADLLLAEQKEQVRKSNARRDRVVKEKEMVAQVKQLVFANRLKIVEGEVVFYFPELNKIKKIYLTKELAGQLRAGRLGIVKCEGKYELVPAETAGKVRERLPGALLFLCDEPESEDSQAEFPIPDDYEW